MTTQGLPFIPDAQQWREFCSVLERAGDQIFRPEAPDDDFNRAEGLRYLTRLLRIGLEMFVECGDRDFPQFYRPSHETAKIGADNPDNYYLRAELNGCHDYRIVGQRGTVHYLGFGTQAGGYGEDGRNESTGFIDARQMEIAEDGHFELILSAEPKPGNWLPMRPETRTVIVRQTFLDRSVERSAALRIERLTAGASPQPLRPAELVQNLLASARFVEGTARLFADWSASYLAHPNELPPGDQALCQSVGGDPNVFYYHGYWELALDQALLIELTSIPECQTWNFQLDNYWMESLDYRYHTIHINKHTAHYRPDGTVVLVVSHQDVGVPNRIDTAGHLNGTMCFRWIGAKAHPHPQCRVVPLAEIYREVLG